MNPCEEIHFDGWTLHKATGELAKGDARIRLQVQPQRILEELLARPGQLVTREHLVARLWPRGIVNFDLSLNNAVHRLRVALGDHAETPRYIETIPRRGYRFIGSVAAPKVRATTSRARWRLPAVVLLLVVASVTVGALSQVDSQRPGSVQPVARADGEARQHVVMAEYFLHRRMPGDFARARRSLEDALSIDPGFAGAWAGLASAYWLDTVEGQMPPAQGLPRVREAAERALELDPRLAEAHLRLANYWWCAGDSRKARAYLTEAVTLEPDNALSLSMLAGMAARNGQMDDAIELQRRAVASGPLSLVNRGNLIAYLMMADRLQEAKVEMLRMRELNAEAPGISALHTRSLVLEGRFDEALDMAAELTDEAERRFSEAIAQHRLGNRAAADDAMRALVEAPRSETPMLLVAEAHAYRGEFDEAFAWLQSMPRDLLNDPSVQHSPFLRPLHADPRWNEWLETTARRQVTRGHRDHS
jgi:DNA-binding winged helix-turn-helix (wHTH) protein/tetratricopeptide (TPR) repeat protein